MFRLVPVYRRRRETIQDSGIFLQPGTIQLVVIILLFNIFHGIENPLFSTVYQAGDQFHPDTIIFTAQADRLQPFPDAGIEIIQIVIDDCFPGKGNRLQVRIFLSGLPLFQAGKINTVLPCLSLHVDVKALIPGGFSVARIHLHCAYVD